MKVVYIAGPYTAPTKEGVSANIAKAEEAARAVWAMGHAAICPHTNSAHFDDVASYETFAEGYLQMLDAADAVLVVGDWRNSRGTCREMAEACFSDVPVFFILRELEIFLEER